MPGYRKAVAILMLAVTAWYSEARAGDAPTYSISIVPQFDHRRIEAIWRPIIERLEPMTGLHFQLVMEPTIPAFEKALNAGAYDFAYMNPYHYSVFHQHTGYMAFAKEKDRRLVGIVVVRQDAP